MRRLGRGAAPRAGDEPRDDRHAAASSTGIPAGVNGVSARATTTAPPATSAREPGARAGDPRPDEREERGRGGGVEPVPARVAQRGRRRSAPASVNSVPQHEDADAGPPEPEPRGVRRLVHRGHGGRLVDRQLRGDRAAPAVGAEQRRDLRAVEPVAHAEQPRGRDRGAGEPARADHADERELRAAREHQQAQRHRLRHATAPRRPRARRTRCRTGPVASDDRDGLPDGGPSLGVLRHAGNCGTARRRQRQIATYTLSRYSSMPASPPSRPEARTTSRRRTARSRPRPARG